MKKKLKISKRNNISSDWEVMEDGGNVNTLEGDLISKVLMERNRDKDFVQRAFAVGQYPGSNMFTQFEDFGTRATHKMGWGEDDMGQSYMFPTIMNDKNEAIKVPNQYADYISEKGYKKATGMKNGGSIPMMPDGGRTPIYVSDKNDPRLQAYTDSLNAYNSFFIGKAFLDSQKGVPLNNKGYGKVLNKLNPSYPNIEPSEKVWYNPDTGKFIKKDKSIKGGELYKYQKPVQPIIYQPEEKKTQYSKNIGNDNPPNTYSKKYPPVYVTDPNDPSIGMYTEAGNQILYKAKERPKLQTIQLDRKEGLLESNPINLGDINPIPFEQGTFFSRERQNQELDSKQFGRKGKKDYFDKKTGKLLGTYGDGGKISLDEFRPKFSNSNQNIQKEIINKQKFENSKVVQQQKTLETIKNLQEKYREKYEPSQSVKNSKSFLSAGQLAQPLNLPLKAIATGADLETSLRYALDGQYNKSLEDLVQAGVNWIPFLQQEKMLNLSKGLPSLAYRFNEAIPKINQATDYIQKGSDIKTIIEVKKNGGKIPKAGDGKNMGYSWSTQQVPTQQVVGSVENTQTSKPSIQPFQKGYVNPKTMTSKTGEEGLGDDLGGMMVTAALAPGSLPFRASSRLGRVGLETLELANPISGFRGIKPKFALQNADPILTNQTKGFNVEYDGLLDFQKKAGFEPYKFDNKNWYDVPDESEINWKAWNEEIPNNKALMQEYNAIEQQAKANGTWMKNPDGSAFQGTPEQFVQQNSSNFKKAFPEGSENVFRGTGENIAELRPNRSTFTANQELASGYAPFNKKSNFLNSESVEGGVHSFYRKNSKNSLELDANNTSWTSVDLSNRRLTKDYFERNIKSQEDQITKQKEYLSKMKQNPNGSWEAPDGTTYSNDLYKNTVAERELYLKDLKERYKNIDNLISNPKELEEMRKVLGNTTTTDDIAAYVEKRNLDYVKLKNIEDSGVGDVTIVNHKPGNYLKSAVGNNGMFDMTNPNIYKGLAPIGIAGAATQIEQKKSGGKVKLRAKSSDWEIVG